MNLFKQFTFKQRNLIQKLTNTATEEELIGERNQRILNKFIIAGILALLCLGVWRAGELILSLIH